MELHIYCQQNKKLGTSTSFPTESSLKCWQNIVNTLWSALRSWRENKEHWGGKMKWRCKPKKQAENGTAFILGHWQHQGYWWSLDFPRLMWHQRQSTGPLRRKESKNRPLLMEPEWEMTPPPPYPPLGLPTKVLPLSPEPKDRGRESLRIRTDTMVSTWGIAWILMICPQTTILVGLMVSPGISKPSLKGTIQPNKEESSHTTPRTRDFKDPLEKQAKRNINYDLKSWNWCRQNMKL